MAENRGTARLSTSPRTGSLGRALLALALVSLFSLLVGSLVLADRASGEARESAVTARGAELLDLRTELSWLHVDEANATRRDLLDGASGEAAVSRRGRFVSERDALTARVEEFARTADSPADEARRMLTVLEEIRTLTPAGNPRDVEVSMDVLTSAQGAALFAGKPAPETPPSRLAAVYELAAASNVPAFVLADAYETWMLLDDPVIPAEEAVWFKQVEPYVEEDAGWLGPNRRSPLEDGVADWKIAPELLPAAVGKVSDIEQFDALWRFDQWVREWQNGTPGAAPLARNVLFRTSSDATAIFRQITRDEIAEERAGADASEGSLGRRVLILRALAAAAGIAALVLLILLLRALRSRSRALIDLATVDPLTGAKNRRYMKEHTAQLLRDESFSSHAAVMVDLDRFKLLNDTYGHQMGDAVLSELSQRGQALLDKLLASGRVTSGAWVRLGGDEFLMVVHSPGQVDASLLLERVRGLGIQPMDDGIHEPATLEFSVGLASSDGPTDLDRLLALADLEAYTDKSRRARDRALDVGREPSPSPEETGLQKGRRDDEATVSRKPI